VSDAAVLRMQMEPQSPLARMQQRVKAREQARRRRSAVRRCSCRHAAVPARGARQVHQVRTAAPQLLLSDCCDELC
jgi:hypothetical protein